MLTLYENIKKRREELGLTKVELAARIGYERSMITKVEQGKVDLTQSKIAAFAKALQTTPGCLLGITNEEKENSLPAGAIPYVSEQMMALPLVGTVSCGTPLFADENIEGYIDTPVSSITSDETYFWLRAKGDSMMNVGIHHGDLLLIRHQNDVDSGDIAVVAVNGDEATLKRVLKKENAIVLQPENPSYETQVFVGKEMELIHIRGRLMQLRKLF